MREGDRVWKKKVEGILAMFCYMMIGLICGLSCNRCRM